MRRFVQQSTSSLSQNHFFCGGDFIPNCSFFSKMSSTTTTFCPDLKQQSPRTSSCSKVPTTLRKNFSELYEQAEIDIQVPIVKAFLKQHKLNNNNNSKSVNYSDQKHNHHNKRNSLLVASAVLASPSTCDCGTVCTCPPLLKFTGVNSALHRQIHHHHHHQKQQNAEKKEMETTSDDGDIAEGVVVIKGLLKGCAEQNALGAFAASGNHFEQIRGIVICSLNVSCCISPSSVMMAQTDCNPNSSNQTVTECCFPCFACRNYLSKVHRFVSQRHPHQLLKLSCVSLKIVENDENKQEEQKEEIQNGKVLQNEQKSKTTTISVDCIPGWSTSFREEILMF